MRFEKFAVNLIEFFFVKHFELNSWEKTIEKVTCSHKYFKPGFPQSGKKAMNHFYFSYFRDAKMDFATIRIFKC